MSRWTHAQCETCWNAFHPASPPTPVMTLTADYVVCCFCGAGTSAGIYVRADPDTTPYCEHEEEE